MKIIITEQEKRNIRQLYGLIVENDSAELLDYANNYIDTHSCDTIYENLLSFQNAVNSGNPKMSNKFIGLSGEFTTNKSAFFKRA